MATDIESDEDILPWDIPEWLQRGSAWTWRLLILAAGIYVAVRLSDLLRLVLVPILIAILFVAFITPTIARIERHGVPRIAATWITLFVAMAVIGGIGWFVTDATVHQLSTGTDWDEVRTEARDWLRDGPAGLTQQEIDNFEDRARDAVLGGVGSVGIDRVRLVSEIVGSTFLSLVLIFFFAKDGPLFWAWLTSRVRPVRRDAVDVAGRAAFVALQGYVRGVALTGMIDAVFIGWALWVIGVPLVLPLAALTFFAAFLPIVGATLVGALAALVALIVNGPGDALWVIGATFAVQQIEGNVVMPMVMRRQISLHPAIILISLAIGGALAGIVGAFAAVPVAAMLSAGGGALRNHGVATDGAPGSMAGDDRGT